MAGTRIQISNRQKIGLIVMVFSMMLNSLTKLVAAQRLALVAAGENQIGRE